MVGMPHLMHDRAKLFLHTSFEKYKGMIFTDATHSFSSPLPLPNSVDIWGPETKGDPPMSTIFDFDGKLTIGSFNLYWQVPYMERYFAGTFPGDVVHQNYGEDTAPGPMGGG